MLNPYNARIVIYCDNDNEAAAVQNHVNDISKDLKLVGSDLLRFFAKYKQNEGVIKPALTDVFRNGVGAISRHIFKLTKLK